jgi:hypothetical protein
MARQKKEIHKVEMTDGKRAIILVLCQDLVQHKMRNFNYFQSLSRILCKPPQ